MTTGPEHEQQQLLQRQFSESLDFEILDFESSSSFSDATTTGSSTTGSSQQQSEDVNNNNNKDRYEKVVNAPTTAVFFVKSSCSKTSPKVCILIGRQEDKVFIIFA